ncbi:MAG TPA: coenzyme F420-0:L-glutamate ligase [Candidatus Dojkabacteria bacterium]|nr:coenzyme F420-0:L-glutamate ligase [Candidatus Dojkabacteria bacterium]
MRNVGTVVRGIRTPIIKNGDNLVDVVVDSLIRASESEGFEFNDRDVVGITEAVVSICDSNYVTVDDVAKEIGKKFGNKEIGLVFPILSRNRFSMILEAVLKACKKVYILFSFPSDEVGNHIVDPKMMEDVSLDDSFDERCFRDIFGYDFRHEFTGMDYIEYYKSLGKEGQVIPHFSNDPREILNLTKNVLVCNIHAREKTKRLVKEAGGEIVYGLEDICNEVVEGRGYNVDYGLLGANKVGDGSMKLFPRAKEGRDLVVKIQDELLEKTGKKVEVMIYGDGAFKDPVGQIWELADPVVSPAYTDGLVGRPKEIKLKVISENWDGNGDIEEYVKNAINEKKKSEYNGENSLGTTPRQLTDLLGSLMDLTSGSGDKGTPVVLVQGYFDDYTVK